MFHNRAVMEFEDRIYEEHEYRDDGCELFPSCLKCPFPKCRYDEPKRNWEKEARNREVLRLYCDEGKGADELARSFGVSTRTIYRIVEGSKGRRGSLKKEAYIE